MEFKPPKGLNLTGDIAQQWKIFKQKFMLFIEANEYKGKTDEVKIAMFLNSIGDEALQLFNTFQLSEAEKTSFDKVITAFETYCNPRKSTVFNRYKFFIRYQEEQESFDHFQTELKRLAQICEFDTQTNSLIRDKIIIGIRDSVLQERLLRETNLTLEKSIEICRAYEISKQQVKTLQQNSEMNVNAIKKTGERKENKFNCSRCNTQHGINKCPAFGKKCHNCGKLNHFSIACKMRKKTKNDKLNVKGSKNIKKVEEINLESSCSAEIDCSADESENSFSIDKLDEIKSNNYEKTCWSHKIFINGKPVIFKMDTGADVNVLPLVKYLDLCQNHELLPSKSKIIAYGGFHVTVEGVVELLCIPEQRDPVKLTFFVIDTTSSPILSLSTCIQLNLISRVNELGVVRNKINVNNELLEEKKNFICQNAKLFKGLGKLPFSYKIRLKEDAVPVVKIS